jgi:SAM-dependent methyltransferase
MEKGIRKRLGGFLLQLSRKLEPGPVQSLPIPNPAYSDDGLEYTGERVISTHKNDCFYAHLSIYNFAKPFIQGKYVLDAGCGSGYGTYYLATQGAANITGIDIGEEAIKFATNCYKKDNLAYLRMDCEKIRFGPQSFDVVYSSNMIEHLDNYELFLDGVKNVIKDGGVFILATPPLYGTEPIGDNEFHHTNLKVSEWIEILAGHFGNIEAYRHFFKTEKKDRTGKPYILDFASAPEDCMIDESDFSFERVPLGKYSSAAGTITALFVLSGKR